MLKLLKKKDRESRLEGGLRFNKIKRVPLLRKSKKKESVGETERETY